MAAGKARLLLEYACRGCRVKRVCLLSVDTAEYVDLLTILLGRILQIQEADERGNAIESEVQVIAQVASVGLISTENDEVREAMLDIVRYLPARSVNEIKMVLQLAEGSTDERIQRACAVALERSRPKTSDDWAVLELGEQSKVMVIRNAVEKL